MHLCGNFIPCYALRLYPRPAYHCTIRFCPKWNDFGRVTDSKTGEPIIGANVLIQGTAVGDVTNLEGQFTIANVKPGTYNLVVSYITYKTHTVPDLLVESGKISTVNISMQEDATELQEVVVSGTREINTDFTLLKSIRESKLVVSGISAE